MNDKRNFGISRRSALGLIGATAASSLVLPASARAPMLGVPTTAFHRFKLGDFEVTIIRDGATSIAGPYPAFGAEQFEEDVHELMTENLLPTKRFELPYAPVVVNTGKELILFDTGNGEARRPERGNLAAGLAAAGYKPDQIDIVVITHCHPDHIGGLMEGGKPFFPNARYICGEKEYDFWSPKERLTDSSQIERRAKVVQANVVPLAPKMVFLKNEGEVAPGIRAISSPGHTPGHLAFHVESKGRRLLLWSDAIVHYVVSVQRPEWKLASDMDHDAAIKSRKMLLGMAAADKIPVTGYHLPFPAIGYIEKKDDGFRYVAASYQLNL